MQNSTNTGAISTGANSADRLLLQQIYKWKNLYNQPHHPNDTFPKITNITSFAEEDIYTRCA